MSKFFAEIYAGALLSTIIYMYSTYIYPSYSYNCRKFTHKIYNPDIILVNQIPTYYRCREKSLYNRYFTDVSANTSPYIQWKNRP